MARRRRALAQPVFHLALPRRRLRRLDYLSIAPRYGTNDDLAALTEAAAARGIRVLADLVAGHTSIDHPWFRASMDDPSDHRYIWADRPGPALVGSSGTRPGWYLKNFFPSSPP